MRSESREVIIAGDHLLSAIVKTECMSCKALDQMRKEVESYKDDDDHINEFLDAFLKLIDAFYAEMREFERGQAARLAKAGLANELPPKPLDPFNASLEELKGIIADSLNGGYAGFKDYPHLYARVKKLMRETGPAILTEQQFGRWLAYHTPGIITYNMMERIDNG